MNDPPNYTGAAVFWLYIIAALSLSAVVIYTILSIQPAEGEKHPSTRNSQILFSFLALLSFTVLSINMLQVLIQSYIAWSQTRQPRLPTPFIALVWTWSVTSTLFLDFAEAIVQNDARFRWAASSLLITFGTCLFFGIEGSRRRIPRLWAFFALSQILPISFTQNLFYLAMLRIPECPIPASASIPFTKVMFLGTGYCGTISILPVAAGSAWLMPLVLATRALLLLPMRVFHGDGGAQISDTTSQDAAPAFQFSPWDCAAIIGLAALLVPIPSTVLTLTNTESLRKALFSNPAVSTLGCDFVLSFISLALWHTTQSLKVTAMS